MRYLFDARDELEKRLRKKDLFIFLDYDGTLVPIKESPAPEKSLLPEGVKKVLARLKDNGNYVAIVSGRSLKDLKKMAGIEGLIYSGNHGLELEGPKISFVNPISAKARTLIRELKYRLIDELSGIKGAFIEDKGLTLSLHYRLVKGCDIPGLVTLFNSVVRRHVNDGRIRIGKGKKIFEIRPPVKWDKGKMVLWLLARYRFAAGEKEIFPVYIGDDTTDEDGFKVLRNRGLTVFVGKPKRSFAEYYLKDTKEVHRFLGSLLRSKES